MWWKILTSCKSVYWKKNPTINPFKIWPCIYIANKQEKLGHVMVKSREMEKKCLRNILYKRKIWELNLCCVLFYRQHCTIKCDTVFGKEISKLLIFVVLYILLLHWKTCYNHAHCSTKQDGKDILCTNSRDEIQTKYKHTQAKTDNRIVMSKQLWLIIYHVVLRQILCLKEICLRKGCQ